MCLEQAALLGRKQAGLCGTGSHLCLQLALGSIVLDFVDPRVDGYFRISRASKGFSKSATRAGSVTPGSSHRSQSSDRRITGTLSCTSRSRALGSVVNIVQDSMTSPAGFFQGSHSYDYCCFGVKRQR